MAVVLVVFDRRFFNRSAHALCLAVGPRMHDFGEPMLNPILTATHVEHVRPVSAL